MPKFIQSNFIL